MDENTQDTQREVGTINWFNTTKGYGFISPDNGGDDVFVHITDLGQGVDPNQLTDGVRVEFSLAEGPKGKNAVEVTIINDEE